MSTFFHQADAQKLSFEQAKPYLEAFQKSIEIPKEYQFHSVEKVKIDKVTAYLFRYEKTENKGMRGEHFSFVISEKEKKILGFTLMDKRYSEEKWLSKQETEQVAKKFLQEIDNTLAEGLKNLWIEPHNEEIIINGKSLSINGMKYKCFRPSHNDYAWVIVGSDRTIITFERDILWDNHQQKRITEKWLHDNWKIKNNK
ncbi:hypothetical protein AB4865_05435 [Capnocytophaga sp. ARDL2]|uniref:hypothetical protein n=1 Tax=Capnocytophaga sp. ARDL2 TaxID=3238809 RepID=UPI003558E5C9